MAFADDPPPRPSLDLCLRWLEHALGDCADALPKRPMVFLWSARRCAESAAIAVALVGGDSIAEDDPGPLSLLPTRVPRSLEAAVRTIVREGDYALHVHPTEVADVAAFASRARMSREPLCLLVEWLYRDKLQRPMAPSVLIDLRTIRAGGAPVDVPVVAQPSRRSPWRGIFWTIVGVGFGAVLTGAWFTAAELRRMVATGAVTLRPREVRERAPDVRAHPEAEVRPVDAGTAPDASHVPPGALVVEEGVVMLGQPDRRRVNWPAPQHPRALPAVTLRAFALDAEPVTVRSFRECVTRLGGCTELDFRGCRSVDPEPDEPAVCATWVQAQDYCRFRHGRLPTLAEWERVADLGLPVRMPQELTFEWVADRYPAAVLDRGAPVSCNDESGARYDDCRHARIGRREPRKLPRFEWGVTGVSHRLGTYGFRCAYDP